MAKKRLTVELTEEQNDLKRRVRSKAIAQGTDLREIVVTALVEFDNNN